MDFLAGQADGRRWMECRSVLERILVGLFAARLAPLLFGILFVGEAALRRRPRCQRIGPFS